MIGSGRWPLSADEAHYWEWSRRLDWSYYSKGPMVAYLIAAGTRLGASTEFWVRLPAVLLGTATAAIAYLLARRTFPEERVGLLSLVLLSVMPLYAVGAVLMTIDAPFVCCWGLAWLCLSRVQKRQGELAWYAAGVAFGLGLLSKYTMFMLVPCVVLWLASSPRLRPWFRRQEPYVAAALGLLIFSPVLVWNARHGWYSLRHVLIQAGGSGERSVWAALLGGPEFFGSQVGVVSPLLFGLLVVGVVWAWREGLRRERDDLTLLVCGLGPGLPLLPGCGASSARSRRTGRPTPTSPPSSPPPGGARPGCGPGSAAAPGSACIGTSSRRSCCRPRSSPWPSPRSSSSGRGSGSRRRWTWWPSGCRDGPSSAGRWVRR